MAPVLLNPSRFGGGGASAYAAAVLADSPLAYWRLGEASGVTTAADASGNGHDGTYTTSAIRGATGLLTGDTDTALGFATGSGECMTVTSAAWMNVSTLTVECLAKFTADVDTGSGDAVVSRLFGSLDWVLHRNTDGTIQASVWNNVGTRYNAISPSALSNNTIYHLAFTFDGSNLKLYVNGSVVATTAVTGTVATASAPIEVGRYSQSGATTPNGTIDEVAIYGSALSSTRIAAHAAAA